MLMPRWKHTTYCSQGCTLLPIYVCWAVPPHDWHWLLRALAAVGLGLLVTCWCTLFADHLTRALAMVKGEDETTQDQCAALVDSKEEIEALSDDDVVGHGAEPEKEEACTREELHSLLAELKHPRRSDNAG